MAILSNTNQILTVKNLAVGGYYTANEAVATNQLVRSNALTVYNYNPITGYTLNVNINIDPYSTSYVFLPSYFFSNKDFQQHLVPLYYLTLLVMNTLIPAL